MRFVGAAVFCTVFVSLLHAQAEWPRPKWDEVETAGCRSSEDTKPQTAEIGAYEVRLVAEGGNSDERDCKAYLVDKSGKRLLLLADFAIGIHQGSREDLFADGHPALVLEGFTGGAHCCYDYRIVSLSEPPVILGSIENESPFYFFRDKTSGQFRIMTSDGAFDYFDGLCHACTVFPRVVLKVDHDGLHDAGPEFAEQYESEIAFARAKIPQREEGQFLESDFKDARTVVLEVVFSYLYSGREAQAWKTLDELWPAKDRERIKKLIIDTRARGLLSKLPGTAPGSQASTH